ncbi:SDR family NAD(P)-dependent oxidoreductase [Candidatus Gracilibacteria bacterium]|nr:SDR family NAD(P)-dependent oxidoreductase [Candidatus Gracilibacteria bacterium]
MKEQSTCLKQSGRSASALAAERAATSTSDKENTVTTQLHDKTVLITGGTGGIGQQTALGLARSGAHVIITGRDRARGEAARTAIIQAGGNPQVDLLLGDLSSQAEVRRLAAAVGARYKRLDVLINNAGLLEATRRLTVDGVEAHFAVNVVAPFLLTQLLFGLLQHSAPARVVNLSGGMPQVQLDRSDLQAERSFRGLSTYSKAKAAMMAMSYEYAQRVAGSGVAINVAYPGGASTAMTGAMTPEMLPPALRLAWPIFRLLMRDDRGLSATKAARSSVFLAASPELAGVSGHYYDTNSKRVAWPKAVLDPEIAPQFGSYARQ